MDSQDQRKTGPSGHESHVHHLCHKCGWPFPNPHPSAKHRRAHKRICGTIEGYKLIDYTADHTHSGLSDDEHCSDEDRQTPSPKVENRSTDEITGGGVGERLNRSEDEVFSDAVTEFLDCGFSPLNEERLEGARVYDKNAENVAQGDPGTDQQLKVDATAGVVQLPNSPTNISQMHNPRVPESETNLLGSVMPANSDSVVSSNNRIEEPAVRVSSENGEAGDLANIKYETLTDSPKGNENVHVLSVAKDILAVDHPEIIVEDVKDHKAVKIHVTLDSGELIEPVVDVNKDTVFEENCSSFLSSKSDESLHVSSAELLDSEGNFKQEDGGNKVLAAEVPVEGEADTSNLKVSSALGSNDVEVPPETTVSGKIKTNSHLEGQQPRDFHTNSSLDILPESTSMGLLYGIPVAISADDEVSHRTNISGGNNAHNHEKDNTEKCETDGKESREVVKEELSTNIETTSESVDNLSVCKADETTNLLGADNSGDHEKTGTEFSDLAGRELGDVAIQENPEMNSKMTLESASNLSESKVVVDDGMDKVMKNLQGTETTTYFVSDSSEVGPDASCLGITIPTHSCFQNGQDEDSQEAMKGPKFNSTDEVLAESVAAACKGAESNHDSGAEVSQKISEISLGHLLVESDFTKISATVEDSHCRDVGFGVSGITTDYLQEEGGDKLTKQPIEVPAVDVSVDSNSQTESLEGNWGSVSGAVLSQQSDALASIDAEALRSTASKALAKSDKVNLQKPKTTSEGHHSNKSDVFEPPSFATLVEPGDRVDQKAAPTGFHMVHNIQQPKSEALQAGWFPSLTNVVNESQGRKKNEEIIAKVTNWSTGKQRTPLKSLLGEANLETKPKSPNPKQTPTVTMKDENTTKNNGALATTVNSIMSAEVITTNQVAKRGMGTEWNSPARYPSDNKKEKRKVKGRPYWVPFVCCSSVN